MTNHDVGWLDQAVAGILGSDGGNLGIFGFFFWLAMAIGGGILTILILKYFYLKFQYEGTEELYPVRFIYMGKEAMLEGNLSVNDSFDEEVMEALELHSDLKFVADVIKDQIKRKVLFIYNFKLTDEGDLTESFAKKIRIISPVDITQPEYTWSDMKGKRNLMSIIRREKRRNIVLYPTTRKVTIFDGDGHEEDYYIVSPIPMVKERTEVGFDSQAISGTATHFVNITKIEGGKALAQMATLAPILSEAILAKVQIEAERDKFATLYNEAITELNDKNMEINDQEHDLYQKMFVGNDRKPEEPKQSMTFGWIVGGILVAYIFSKLLPELLGSVDPQISEITGVGIGVLVIGFIWKYVTDQQKTLREKNKEMKN